MLLYINQQLKLAKKSKTTIRFSSSSKDKKFSSFGDKNRYKHGIQIQSSFMSDFFAVNIAPSYIYSDNAEKEFKLDSSYLAAFWGNWSISVGKQDRWFGPQWDSSFSLTNNAQPIPTISLSRVSAIPFTIPFTDHKVPWTMTTFMGLMDDNRTVNNTLLWGFRLNLKPLKSLEIGITRLSQWGGESNSTSLCSFFDILIGKTNGPSSGSSSCGGDHFTVANQQAGFDARYSLNLFDTSIGIYGNYFAEDGANESRFDLNFFTKAEIQLGLDAQLMFFNTPTMLFVEYGDSLADCGERDGTGNCFYEHSKYQTGLRYEARPIGNLYDNDAKTIVIGAISQLQNNTKITTKLRLLDLNYDNSDKAPTNKSIGNSLTEVAEKMIMISTNIEHEYKNWLISVGGEFSRSTFENDIKDKQQINISLDVEYHL